MAKLGTEIEEQAKQFVNALQNPLSPPEPNQVFLEYFGDLTPAAANEILAGLENINRNFNHIYKALDTGYHVDGRFDGSGKFLGLELSPDPDGPETINKD
jgi:hypothetical protein